MREGAGRAFRSLVVSGLVSVLTGGLAVGAGPDWTQWGGPHRDFSLETDPGLVSPWPDGGPPLLWKRDLGEHGHSGILAEDGRLYTMVRRGEQDVVLALDAGSGETLWEHAYDSPLPENYNTQFGPGPHATPLLAGERLFTVGALVKLRCLDKATGELLWGKDLLEEMDAAFMYRGYGASPIAFEDLVILNVGGEGQGLVAFRQSDGEPVWRSLDGGGSYSSPVLMEIAGTTQLVAALGPKRAGLDPKTGEVLWQIDLPQTAATTMSTQVQVGDELIFASSAYADGSRVLKVSQRGGSFQAEELWYSRKMRVMHGSVAQFGDLVYGSSGDFGPTFLAAIDVRTGELAFRQRGFAKANLMRIGDRVLILDEDGKLALGRPSAEGIEIDSEAQILDGVTWTAPTLVGTTLYVRSREEIAAFDLGARG